MEELNLTWADLYRAIQESGLDPVGFARKVGVNPLWIGMVKAGKPVPEASWKKLVMAIHGWEEWKGVTR